MIGYEIKKPVIDLGPHVAPTELSFTLQMHFPLNIKIPPLQLYMALEQLKKVGYKVIGLHLMMLEIQFQLMISLPVS